MTDNLPTSASEGLICNLCGSPEAKRLYDLGAFKIVRCVNCGLVYSTLPARRQQFQDLYNEQYFASRNEYFFQNPINNPAITEDGASIRSLRHGLDLIQHYHRSGNLLDVGCAVGVFLTLAQQAGFNTWGSDISSYAVDYCTAKGYNARCGDLDQLDLPDQYFDVVTLWDVIEHFPDPSHQLQQIRRILTPDGIVLMDTPNEDGLLRELARWLHRASLAHFNYPVRKLYHKFHLYYFTQRTLETLLRNNGFKLVYLERNRIPLVKARGSWLERQLVRVLRAPERLLGREFEMLAIAKKANE